MSEEFDLNAIVLIGAAFIVGYWVVGVVITRLKRGRGEGSPRESTGTEPASRGPASPAEQEARAMREREAEYQRVQEAAQRLREQASARAEEERRRRQERESRGG